MFCYGLLAQKMINMLGSRKVAEVRAYVWTSKMDYMLENCSVTEMVVAEKSPPKASFTVVI